MPQSKQQSDLSAVATEFQQERHVPETAQMQQPHVLDPVAVPESVCMPVLAATPPAKELQEELWWQWLGG